MNQFLRDNVLFKSLSRQRHIKQSENLLNGVWTEVACN